MRILTTAVGIVAAILISLASCPGQADQAHQPVSPVTPASISPDAEWFYFYVTCGYANCVPGHEIRAPCRIAMNQTGNTGGISCGPGWASRQDTPMHAPSTWVTLDFSRVFSAEKVEQLRQQCEPDLPCAGHAIFKLLSPSSLGENRAVLVEFN
jgi:hypothetical protein